MTAIDKKDLKKEVLAYINQADDRMLKVIHAILEADSQKEDDDWHASVTKEEKTAINNALRQLDNNQRIPHEEAKKLLKWFPK